MKHTLTHEQFVSRVRDVVASNVAHPETRDRVKNAKLVYGIGDGSYRGICYFDAWKNGTPKPVELVEVAATGEESPVQLAGTTIHELGHVIAGKDAGHDSTWKATCHLLGLRAAKVAGTRYSLAHFAPEIRHAIAKLGTCDDGTPIFGTAATSKTFVGLPPINLRPCPLGIGTKGGKSRGTGSGSRLRLYVCQCRDAKDKPKVKVRVASDEFKAHCDVCHGAFKREETKAS